MDAFLESLPIVVPLAFIGVLVLSFILFRFLGERSETAQAPAKTEVPAKQTVPPMKASEVDRPASPTPPKPPMHPTPQRPNLEQLAELAAKSPKEGAFQLLRLGRIREAASIYAESGDHLAASDLYLSINDKEKALLNLKKAIEGDAEKSGLYEKYIALLIDQGEFDEAQRVLKQFRETLTDHLLPGRTLETVAQVFESIGKFAEAIALYGEAKSFAGASGEITNRLEYLEKLSSLKSAAASEAYRVKPATALLDQYIRESSSEISPVAKNEREDFSGNEIIIGHLALGFQQSEPGYSSRSIFSPARRFAIKRTLSSNQYSAVFEANDELLDFPVVLKLVRLPAESSHLIILRDRLRALAKLNHPSLAKLTFADRTGLVLRVSTEYLPGGNLREFLNKIGSIGKPLLMRIALHLASALHAAHLKGIPHGDLRPENVLMGLDQRFKLVDFALSPIPVRYVEFRGATVSDTGETPQTSEFVIHNEGILSDLYQFAEILDFMLPFVRIDGDPGEPDEDLNELREIISSLRSGGFTSVLRLWQVLEQIYERTLPRQGRS